MSDVRATFNYRSSEGLSGQFTITIRGTSTSSLWGAAAKKALSEINRLKPGAILEMLEMV